MNSDSEARPRARSGHGGGGDQARAPEGSQVGTAGQRTPRKDWRKPEDRRNRSRRRKRGGGSNANSPHGERPSENAQSSEAGERPQRGPRAEAADRGGRPGRGGHGQGGHGQGGHGQGGHGQGGKRRPGPPQQQARSNRSGNGTATLDKRGQAQPRSGGKAVGAAQGGKPSEAVAGLFLAEKGGGGFLRRRDKDFIAQKDDVHVPQRVAQNGKLRDGMWVEGVAGPGFGKHKRSLVGITAIDGEDPKRWADAPLFKSLTSIDPDFQYTVGDATGDVSLRVLDIICPVGRGSRGLIVAPPRTGKTVLMQKFARAIEQIYPDVKLMVLLVDERPEEATEWRRSTQGEVFVSTNDEPPKRHVQLAEAVWKRCQRLVEIGEDVVLLLDSITRLARAYNNTAGAGSGRTLSGGLDTRAMERPKQFFGSARNTEKAGSLTILGTTLIETGSRLDQVVFEEFKGTGNMEIVLSRKLADRRIFPAIDLERSGTRKEEKLISSHRLRQINTLRRVLARMHFTEAMELLITKLEDVEKTDDFLVRFEVDPEA